jgi:hypothetical protein
MPPQQHPSAVLILIKKSVQKLFREPVFHHDDGRAREISQTRLLASMIQSLNQQQHSDIIKNRNFRIFALRRTSNCRKIIYCRF